MLSLILTFGLPSLALGLSAFARATLARILLGWGGVVYLLAFGLTMMFEVHCGGGLLKGLGPCPAGPWVNDIALVMDDVLVPVVLSAVFLGPVLALTALIAEWRARRAQPPIG